MKRPADIGMYVKESGKVSIYKKLLEVQKKLKAPKGQYNSFGKYHYRSCEDILEALKPLLAEQNLVLRISDELVLIGERYYIKATTTLTDTETGEETTTTAYAREEENKKGMDGSQVTGASSSYARKYALNGLFCIDDTKDSDATNTHGKSEENADLAKRPDTPKPKKQTITLDQETELTDLINEAKAKLPEVLKFYKVKKLSDMTPEQYNHCKNYLQKKIS